MPDDDVAYSVELSKFIGDSVVETIRIEGYGLLEELMDDLEKLIEQRKWKRYDKDSEGTNES